VKKFLHIFAIITSVFLFTIYIPTYVSIDNDGKYNTYKEPQTAVGVYAVVTVIYDDFARGEDLVERGGLISLIIELAIYLQMLIWLLVNLIVVLNILPATRDIMNAPTEHARAIAFISRNPLLFSLLLIIWNSVLIYGLWSASGGNLWDYHQYVN